LIQLQEGLTQLGRGSLTRINNRKCSRHQANIVINNNNNYNDDNYNYNDNDDNYNSSLSVVLTPVGLNPMVLERRDGSLIVLKKHESYTLNEGDTLFLCGREHPFTLQFSQRSSTSSNNSSSNNSNSNINSSNKLTNNTSKETLSSNSVSPPSRERGPTEKRANSNQTQEDEESQSTLSDHANDRYTPTFPVVSRKRNHSLSDEDGHEDVRSKPGDSVTEKKRKKK